MKRIAAFLVFITIIAMIGCTQKQPNAEKTVLFNGTDFTGWILDVDSDSVDVTEVWSVKDGVVHCTGDPFGYMMTEASYSNYKLHLEWRWIDDPTNSGVLLHCGDDLDGIYWPNCFECQLKTQRAGDFVLIGPGQVTVDDSTYVCPERFLSVPRKHDSNEKPVGEWNTYDIEVRGNAVACYVNGLMQNNGTDLLVSEGPIALQSEGSPIEFRNIYLTALE